MQMKRCFWEFLGIVIILIMTDIDIVNNSYFIKLGFSLLHPMTNIEILFQSLDTHSENSDIFIVKLARTDAYDIISPTTTSYKYLHAPALSSSYLHYVALQREITDIYLILY